MSQDPFDLLSGNTRKPTQEIVDPRSALQIFEQCSNGYSGSLENPCAADFISVLLDDGAFAPIQHIPIVDTPWFADKSNHELATRSPARMILRP